MMQLMYSQKFSMYTWLHIIGNNEEKHTDYSNIYFK